MTKIKLSADTDARNAFFWNRFKLSVDHFDRLVTILRWQDEALSDGQARMKAWMGGPNLLSRALEIGVPGYDRLLQDFVGNGLTEEVTTPNLRRGDFVLHAGCYLELGPRTVIEAEGADPDAAPVVAFSTKLKGKVENATMPPHWAEGFEVQGNHRAVWRRVVLFPVEVGSWRSRAQ